MTDNKKIVTKNGHAMIDKNSDHVRKSMFCGNQDLCHVKIPANICSIRKKAFCACQNLKTLKFSEETLTEIGDKAFADCPKLEHVVLPDSVTNIGLYAFMDCTGLKRPVYNRSHTVLYHYPRHMKSRQWQVPRTVWKIAATAFTRNDHLEEVILPDSVTELEEKAFYKSGIRSIIIPGSVKIIREETFVDCKQLETVILQSDQTEIEYNAFSGAPDSLKIIRNIWPVRAYETYWALGKPFLEAMPGPFSHKPYPDDPDLMALSERIRMGDDSAMWEMATHFEQCCTPEEPFYELAANYWRFLSCLADDPRGMLWYLKWEREHPGQRIPAVLNERHCGFGIPGLLLRCLGYFGFDAHRVYDLYPTDSCGVAMVCIHPYDDGSWESCNKQLTFFDKHLNPLMEETLLYHPKSNPDPRQHDLDFIALKIRAVILARERENSF